MSKTIDRSQAKVKASDKKAAQKREQGAKDSASVRKPAKEVPVKGQGYDDRYVSKLALALAKADGLTLDGDEQKDMEADVVSFLNAEGREPRCIAELWAWKDTPQTLHGAASKKPGTPWATYLRQNPINQSPPAKGTVRGTGLTCVHSPVPFELKGKRKVLARNGGKEAFETAKDREEKGENGEMVRMATKASPKGRDGLTMKDAQALLKTAKGTGARGYSEKVTLLCKQEFGGRTVSTLKSAELNRLVVLCRQAKLVK